MERYVIDVGGFLFASTRETFYKSPTLKRLIELHDERTRRKNTADAETFAFVDRDCFLFNIILSYLRNGKVFIDGNEILNESLQIECEFFELPCMRAYLRACKRANA